MTVREGTITMKAVMLWCQKSKEAESVKKSQSGCNILLSLCCDLKRTTRKLGVF